MLHSSLRIQHERIGPLEFSIELMEDSMSQSPISEGRSDQSFVDYYLVQCIFRAIPSFSTQREHLGSLDTLNEEIQGSIRSSDKSTVFS
jgi:hypothetical protein